eukprot:363429-Chlamydomonas_euryale.AAC.4
MQLCLSPEGLPLHPVSPRVCQGGFGLLETSVWRREWRGRQRGRSVLRRERRWRQEGGTPKKTSRDEFKKVASKSRGRGAGAKRKGRLDRV